MRVRQINTKDFLAPVTELNNEKLNEVLAPGKDKTSRELTRDVPFFILPSSFPLYPMHHRPKISDLKLLLAFNFILSILSMTDK